MGRTARVFIRKNRKGDQVVSMQAVALTCGVSVQAARGYFKRHPEHTLEDAAEHYDPGTAHYCPCGCGQKVSRNGIVVPEHKTKYYKGLVAQGLLEPTGYSVCKQCGKSFPYYKELPSSTRKQHCCRKCSRASALEVMAEKAVAAAPPDEAEDWQEEESEGARATLASIPEPTKWDRLYGYGPEDPNHGGKY